MEDVSIIKPNELENYAKEITTRDFFELFPSDKYAFDQNKYAYYLYLGETELEKYIVDYMTFLARSNTAEVFDNTKYFAVWEEFCNYLERENVYVHYKTKMGAFYLNKAVDTKNYLVRDGYLTAEGKPNAFTKKYFYPFFGYLENKLRASTIVGECTVEGLEPEDLMYFQEVYMGKVKLENPPFFLDEKNKSYKFARSFVVTNILPKTTAENAYLLSVSRKVVGLAFAGAVQNGSVALTIMTDADYMDSGFVEFLNIFKTIYKDKASKIVAKNINRGIASSNLNTACVLAHFKLDYDNFSQVDGYTQYDCVFKYSDEEDVDDFVKMTTPAFAKLD